MSDRAKELARDLAGHSIVTQALERYLTQVIEVCAEHEKAAVAAEREACAKIADTAAFSMEEPGYERDRRIAAAIRARITP
jgi:hypothetical protein